MKVTPLNVLLATTFLSTSVLANMTNEVNTNYLNSLTGKKSLGKR